ncbi:MAG: hypothetical protein ACK4UN_12885 [Limisphaerales bacterium]
MNYHETAQYLQEKHGLKVSHWTVREWTKRPRGLRMKKLGHRTVFIRQVDVEKFLEAP